MANNSAPQPLIPPTPSVNIHEHSFHFGPLFKKSLFVILPLIGIGIGAIIGYFFSQSNLPRHTLTVKGVGSVGIPANEETIIMSFPPVEAGSGCNIVYTHEDCVIYYNAAAVKLKQELLSLGLSDQDIKVQYNPLSLSIARLTPQPTTSVESATVDSNGPVVSTITILLNDKTIKQSSGVRKLINTYLSQYLHLDYPREYIDDKRDIKIKDLSVYKSQARDLALKDAANQVARIAAVNNKRIGKILSLKNIDTLSREPAIDADGTIQLDASLDESGTTLIAAYEVTYEEY